MAITRFVSEQKKYELFYVPVYERAKREAVRMSTHRIEDELKRLYKNTPADTGMPTGVRRDSHCFRQMPCPKCRGWIEWGARITALTDELQKYQPKGK